MDKTVIPGAVEGEIEPPSSKSYAQRAIAAALLADGGVDGDKGGGNGRSESTGRSSETGPSEVLPRNKSILRGIEMCDDTAAALRVVQELGAQVERIDHSTYSITGASDNRFSVENARTQGLRSDGQGSVPDVRDRANDERNEVGGRSIPKILNIGESGLSTRLFTPIAALSPNPITITGHGSILRRPMTMMTGPLRELGVEVTDNDGLLPLTVRGPMRGGEVWLDGSVSSQFLTGLLMSLPLAAEGTTIHVDGLKSFPYIDMTIDTMDKFGIDIDHRDYEEFWVPGGQTYTPADFRIEGDWSAASCLLVAGAVAGRNADSGISCAGVTVRNLNPVSLQADVAIIEALSRAGARIEQSGNGRSESTGASLRTEWNEVKQSGHENIVTVSKPSSNLGLRAFEFDATDCPDLFPALVALAANCEGTSVITGTGRLVHKESNRAETLCSEYGKLGIEVDLPEENVMRIVGGTIGGGTVESHGDHRIAMSLAVAALNASGPVTILGAECVSKSYGNFWDDFEKLRTKNEK